VERYPQLNEYYRFFNVPEGAWSSTNICRNSRQGLCIQPQRTSTDGRIDTDLLPPASLITRAMRLSVMAATEGYSEFIANLPAECPPLREPKMMRIPSCSGNSASFADRAPAARARKIVSR
jgi:hypothetical protein